MTANEPHEVRLGTIYFSKEDLPWSTVLKKSLSEVSNQRLLGLKQKRCLFNIPAPKDLQVTGIAEIKTVRTNATPQNIIKL